MSTLRFVYITCRDEDQARRIGRALVEARLAACANVSTAISSCYWWQGAIETDEEAVLVLKTTAACMPALIGLVKALHSYAVPCIVALPILEANPDYAAWIGENVTAS